MTTRNGFTTNKSDQEIRIGTGAGSSRPLISRFIRNTASVLPLIHGREEYNIVYNVIAAYEG
jgi:hypothetical protein